MGFSTYDDLINEITTNGKFQEWSGFKYGPAAEAAGVWTRLWASAGMPGVAAAGTASNASEQNLLIVVTGGDHTGAGSNIKLTITSNTVLAVNDTINVGGITGTGTFGTDANSATGAGATNSQFTISAVNSATVIELAGTSAGSGVWSAGGIVYKTATYTNTLVNAGMGFADVSSDTRHLLTFGATATQDCVVMLYDRLVSVQGLNIASTTAMNFVTPPLPRYSGTASAGVEAWLEWSVAGATTTPTFTLGSYTDNDGNTGQTSGLVSPAIASPVVQSVFPIALAAGDKGIRAAAQLTMGTASTSAVGTLSLIKPLAYLPLQSNQWNEQDFVLQLSSLPRIYDGACLSLQFLASITTAANYNYHIRCAYG